MNFSKEKSYVTRDLNILDFIEYDSKTILNYKYKFADKKSKKIYNLAENGRLLLEFELEDDVITEVEKPTIYYPDSTFHIDDLFNIVQCNIDIPYLTINTFAKNISKTAFANSTCPEIELDDGSLGTIIKSIKSVNIENALVKKIRLLSKALDIELEGI